VLVRHDVDRPAWASSASSESGSLELLLTLDALVGAAILRRTNGCSSTARARCAAQPPLSRAHAHTSRGCARQGCGVMRRRAGPASLHPRPTIHGAAPCSRLRSRPEHAFYAEYHPLSVRPGLSGLALLPRPARSRVRAPPSRRTAQLAPQSRFGRRRPRGSNSPIARGTRDRYAGCPPSASPSR